VSAALANELLHLVVLDQQDGVTRWFLLCHAPVRTPASFRQQPVDLDRP
jgi:hypothetical protein